MHFEIWQKEVMCSGCVGCVMEFNEHGESLL